MSRCCLSALLGLLVCAAATLAEEEKKKDGPDTKAVDVRFADGSTIRMVLLQESLEVETKYGKLTVPTDEVRRIEFAFRVPEETSKKIETAIRGLGHELHARR